VTHKDIQEDRIFSISNHDESCCD